MRSLFTVSPSHEVSTQLGLDPSLTRLSSFGVEAGLIALPLLPSRNSTSLHTRHGGSLLF